VPERKAGGSGAIAIAGNIAEHTCGRGLRPARLVDRASCAAHYAQPSTRFSLTRQLDLSLGGAPLFPVIPQVRTRPGAPANFRLCARNRREHLQQPGTLRTVLAAPRPFTGTLYFHVLERDESANRKRRRAPSGPNQKTPERATRHLALMFGSFPAGKRIVLTFFWMQTSGCGNPSVWRTV
jgi:hypothetical protein